MRCCRARNVIGILAALGLAWGLAGAATPVTTPAAAPQVTVASDTLPVQRRVLPNGLRVLLYPVHRAPVVNCRLFYVTGSVHEQAGASGLAHLLEHMLFKGTQKVGVKDAALDAKFVATIDSLQVLAAAEKERLAGVQAASGAALASADSAALRGLLAQSDSVLTLQRANMVDNELWESYQRNGGTDLNAFTTDQMTAYFVTLPREKMELFFWLESDRMQNAVLREFYPERDVVREERRMRYDDSPTGRYSESLEAVFWEAHPYRIPTIGWAEDIVRLSRAQAEEHYRRYYKPNNAILVLSGDFRVSQVDSLVQAYFAPIPRGESFPADHYPEPEQVGAKRFVQYKDDAKPRLDLMFHTPGVGHADLYALDIVEGVLNGRSGRLYRSLVLQQGLVNGVDAGNYARKDASSFEFHLQLKPEVPVDSVETALWRDLRALQAAPIDARELQKVKNQMRASTWRSLRDPAYVATQLAFYEMYGDWKIITSWADRVDRVTAEQVQAVAGKLFRYDRSTTGVILPAALSPDATAKTLSKSGAK